MNHDERSQYTTRYRVLRLLSDAEIASVSTAETAPCLDTGDEYLDLEQLDRGVRCAFKEDPPMGRVLPKKAVGAETWRKILREVAGPYIATPHSGQRTDDSR